MQTSKRLNDLKDRIVDEQPHQSDERQLKKRRTRLEIFHLPKDIIDIIIFFIPDGYLETYLDIPFIGEYAANRFYRYLEILPLVANTYPLKSPYTYPSKSSNYAYMEHELVEPNRYQTMSTRKTEKFRLPNFLIHPNEDGGSGDTYYRQLSLNAFVQLSNKYPRFQPKVVHFTTFNRFSWMHERYPGILARLPHIDISFEDRIILTSQSVFNSQYNIYRVFNIPEQFINSKAFSDISSLCTRSFPIGIGKCWAETLQELYLYDPRLDLNVISKMDSHFPRLKKLGLEIFIQFSKLFSCFPSNLEFLQIRMMEEDYGCFANRWDFSYLTYLKQFVVDTGFSLDTLDRFKFPRGIERVTICAADTGELFPDPTSFDSIEMYPNLKEFRVRYRSEKRKVLSHNTYFPKTLQKLEISVAALENPSVELGENLRFPGDLKVLQIYSYHGDYEPENLVLPGSLRILSLFNETDEEFEESYDWAGVKFPESLVQLNMMCTKGDGIPFPKSLRGLYINTLYDSTLNFLTLENLVQLKYLSWNRFLSEIIVEAPNLKSVVLEATGFTSIDPSTFQLPDCVELLYLSTPMGIEVTVPNTLPTSLTHLYLPSSYLSSDLLNKLQLQDYKRLVKLDLSDNDISHLGNNSLPSSLEWLRLDKNPISTFSNSEVFSDLRRLRELNISHTNVNDYLQTGELKFPSSLISLNLAENNLEKDVVGHLILSSCTQLQELCLVGSVDIEVVQEIVDVIKSTCPDMIRSEGRVLCKLKKSLYGLKQAPLCWNKKITEILENLKFKRLLSEPGIYVRDGIILGLYVDDILVVCKEETEYQELRKQLATKVNVKDLGLAKKFLGINIEQTKEGIKLSLSDYIDKLLGDWNLTDGKEKRTPFISDTDIKSAVTKGGDVNIKEYRSLVGQLLFASTTVRFDVAFVVSCLSRNFQNPSMGDMAAAKHVLRYLKGTKDYSLSYNAQEGLEVYCDSDWGSHEDDRRSISGYIFKLAGAPVSWKSKKQPSVALSTAEGEYMALAEATKETLWILQLLEECEIEVKLPVIVYEDNEAARILANHNAYHAGTKHIDIRYHFVRDHVLNRIINIVKVASANNLADIFTKSMSEFQFKALINQSGLKE
ncbi:uncharacterized protein J8A68_000952 [[Candida] subhashii]|uniref:Reverse transcriptase Ty1/copia-type domain-containing protein n=1 Tax=[Candida] subhashii TaxID=561895 RepID=A0A8J5QTC6_9ASCO|nr:uncharacterized protein J8A68_000952 [[Candida] subhashii]KAG7665550.1 hypothetical protein J8A68_000952 [[Candida] subhashii]